MLDVYIESSPKKTLELEFSVSILSIVGVFVVSRQREMVLRVQGRVVIDYVGCVHCVQP